MNIEYPYNGLFCITLKRSQDGAALLSFALSPGKHYLAQWNSQMYPNDTTINNYTCHHPNEHNHGRNSKTG